MAPDSVHYAQVHTVVDDKNNRSIMNINPDASVVVDATREVRVKLYMTGQVRCLCTTTMT